MNSASDSKSNGVAVAQNGRSGLWHARADVTMRGPFPVEIRSSE